MQNITALFNQFWTVYIDWIEFFFHTNQLRTKIIGIVILVWFFSLLVILPLHRLSLRKQKQAKQDLVNSVDKVIYLLSKAQYSLSQEQTLKYDPCFALMKTMFGSGHFEYLDNLDTIKENVKKVEVLLKQRVISDEQWKKIDNQKNSLRFHTFWKKFLGYELNLVSLGIYNLFW